MKAYSIAALVLITVASTACVSPSPPPTHAFAKYTRLAGDRQASGQVMATASAAVVDPADDDGDVWLVLPVVEAAVAFRPTEVYDVTVSANTAKLDLDASLAPFTSERFRLAILHGVGVGILTEFGDGNSDSIFADLTAGLLLEFLVGRQNSLFLGGKYTYTVGTSEGFANTHWAGGSVGINFGSDNVCVSPELVVARMAMSDADPEDNLWFILPSLTVSGLF